MDIYLVLKGWVLGLSIAAPVGPIGILCIRRTLANGRRAGLASGLGAATADAIYGMVAGFGLTFVSDALVGRQGLLEWAGGFFLCYLGVRTWLSPFDPGAASETGKSWLGSYGSTFLLTLTNPVTILSFAGVFAGLGLGAWDQGFGPAVSLVGGVFAGSATWWILLTGVVHHLRSRIGPRWLRWINRGAALVLAAFGLSALIRAFATSFR